jgi:Micrococcal nuclease (thermonuclease) homologs
MKQQLFYKIRAIFYLVTVATLAVIVMSACRHLEVAGGALELPRAEILSKTWPAQIVGITDGDTVKVRLQGEGDQIKIRLYGIDAPEKGQPFGRKSREFLMELTLIGSTITVEPVNFDRYDRLVAILYDADGRCLNQALVEAGLAWVYPRYCRQPVCASWSRAEELARRNRTGLWTETSPTPPWEWRKR